MYKKYILLCFSLLLVAFGVIFCYKDYKKYSSKEKIIAQIDDVDKQEYEYEYYDEDAVGNKYKTKTAYYKHIYYSFNYNGVQLNGVDELYSVFMKKGNEITIYYDKNNNSSEIYIIPINKIYLLFTGIIYFIITTLIFMKKSNTNFLFGYQMNATWVAQIFSILSSYFCYRPHDNVSYYMSYFFMIIGILISINCLKETIKNTK